MSAPRDPKSLRTMITLALLDSFQKGSHGPTGEVAEMIVAKGYHPNSLKVQTAQVRNVLLAKIGITLPFEVKGRMTKDMTKQIDQRLRLPQFKARSAELAKELRKVA